MQPDKERSLKVLLFLVLFAVDVALNAAAGPAAVATGAHVNDPSAPPPSGRALGIGATSGAIKAGVMAFIGLLQAVDLALRLTNLGVRPVPQYIIGIAINMVIYFGLSVLISAYVCLEVLGEAPSELLKAAVVAALPIQLEKMMQGEISLRKTTTTAGGQYTKVSQWRRLLSLLLTLSIRHLPIIGWNALGGYTFARMAENLGRPVCSRGAAAAAGGVYGAVSGISTLISDKARSWFQDSVKAGRGESQGAGDLELR
ncbi:hypothetical protein RB599_003758 [Gaeumannomyces hyphopodioides]